MGQQPPAAKYLGLGNLTWKTDGPDDVPLDVVSQNLNDILNDENNKFIGFSVGKVGQDHLVNLPPIRPHNEFARKVLVHLQEFDHNWGPSISVMRSIASLVIGCSTLLIADVAPGGNPALTGSRGSFVRGKERMSQTELEPSSGAGFKYQRQLPNRNAPGLHVSAIVYVCLWS